MPQIAFNLNTYVDSHPKQGYILFLVIIGILILSHFAKNTVFYSKLIAKFVSPFAKKFKFKLLQKTAIKYDIQGKVNAVVSIFSKEITQHNLKPLEVEWVNSTSVESFIEENKILVRIKPIDRQDDNILNVTQPYLEAILLPYSAQLLEEVQRKAIVHFATSLIISNDDQTEKRYHDKFYLPDCLKYKTLHDYYTNIDEIYKRGLFFSVVISSIEYAANNNRYKIKRLGSDFSQIISHLKTFIQDLGKADEQSKAKNWEYHGSVMSYGLLLVAMPIKAQSGNVKPYINRAIEHLKTSDLLFVAFSNKENNFGLRVASAIENQLPIRMVDELKSKYDYRGALNGIVRIYLKNKTP